MTKTKARIRADMKDMKSRIYSNMQSERRMRMCRIKKRRPRVKKGISKRRRVEKIDI